MATTAAPHGLRAVNLVGGQPYAGSTRLLKIASGYDTNIFNGSVVSIVADGVVEIVANVGTDADPFPAGTVGVFVGCSYTDPNTKQKLFAQNWPADTVADDAVAYVVDDPHVVFKVQADAAVTQVALGSNIALVNPAAGDTTTGNSTAAADVDTLDVTSTIAFKIIDFVDSPNSTVGDAFTDLLVKFNPSSHAYTNGTGI